jgi:hypothetical protein
LRPRRQKCLLQIQRQVLRITHRIKRPRRGGVWLAVKRRGRCERGGEKASAAMDRRARPVFGLRRRPGISSALRRPAGF